MSDISDKESPADWRPEIPEKHPSLFEAGTLIPAVLLGVLGIVIGAELLTRVGITPNTSVIGAIVAMAAARIPLRALGKLRSVHRQNLMQTVISGATFGGANALLLPAGILWLFGRTDLVPVMLMGSAIGLLVDMTILYKVFDTPSFPARGIWPPGAATAETIIAGDSGGKRGLTLLGGAVIGGIGSWLGAPMDIFGVCWIGNIWALSAFAGGLLIRGYSVSLFGVDLTEIYLPHGMMIGAGIVALVQIISIMRSKAETRESVPFTRENRDLQRGFGRGFLFFLGGAVLVALLGGLAAEMPLWQLLLFVLFAALAAEVSEILVGLSAMHAGWFPAFATALIFLVLGMIIGFPPVALALLVGYTAATGPAFADMGYDLKAGWILRGSGAHPEFERQGRRQQYMAELVGFGCALIFVSIFHGAYFNRDLFPPVNRVFVATIEAGTSPEVFRRLLIWAIPGAIIQWVGGAKRQMGVLLATGLLINFPIAGWTAAAALITRVILIKVKGRAFQSTMYVLAGGFIAGSALVSFGRGTMRAFFRKS